ncbi:alginate lyase family protein [Alphaproteobacteria bacterium]|nr:alginate lyase family protein [Alphaproteobacteria bacterium]
MRFLLAFVMIYAVLSLKAEPSNASEFKSQIENFKSSFDITGENTSFNNTQIQNNAKANAAFCIPSKWNTLRNGLYNDVSFSKTIEIEGDNLKDFRVNTRPVILKLYKLLLEKSKNPASMASKYFLLGMVENEAFTSIKPHQFERNNSLLYSGSFDMRKYDQYKEQIAKSAMLLLASSIAIEMNREQFSSDDLNKLNNWGKRVLQTHIKQPSEALNITNEVGEYLGSEDIKSQIAAGYIAFGISTQNQQMLELGLDLFAAVVEEISPKGTFERFFKNHETLEMKYHHTVIGYLAVSAYILKNQGFDVFSLKNANGSSLKESISFVVNNTFEDRYPKLLGTQQDRVYLDGVRNTFNSMAWLELAYASFPEFSKNADFMAALNYRNTTATWITESKAGFFGGDMAGYTSCFFSNLPPEKEVIEKVEMMNFYQNTTFEQRQCFFKLFSSPDLLVLFKSNETLPTERLEERRVEGYLSCRDK